MIPTTHWTRASFALAGILATNACALDAADEVREDDGTTELAQDVILSPNPCTLVKVTAPTTPFFGSVGVPITLSAVATCPPGVTPEYQFWFKPVNAANWQTRAAYVPGSSSWTPPSAGDWAITVVTRAVGAPENYQARANAVLGTITGSANRPPIAIEDTITTNLNTRGSTNVLANDSDPDADVLTVASFTQGAHGAVTIANGNASYTPVTGYSGDDSFTYTIDDGHGATATATVFVAVDKSPACTISIVGPGTGVYGQNMHFTSSPACVFGAPEVQWYRKLNSAYVVVQPFSPTTTLDLTADAVRTELFYARVRMQGSTTIQATSNTVSVIVSDNTPQCTQVKVTAPTANQNLPVGMPQTLTASATCPGDSVPEYQFWVKPAAESNWQILPGYTTGSGSWSPPSIGAWHVKAVVRTVGSHVNYQLGSMAVPVNVVAASGVCGDGNLDAGEACDDGNVLDGDGCDHTCALEGCAGASCPATPQMLVAINDENGHLERIDPTTLTVTDIGPLGVSYAFGDCAYDSADSTLYMVDGRGANALYRVNMATGAATLVGIHGIGDLFALGYHPPTNKLYGINGQGNLYSLSTTTGAATLIGEPIGTAIDGLAFDSVRNRFVSLEAGNAIFSAINVSTAQSSQLAQTSYINNLGMTYDPFLDRLWVVDYDGNLIEFDPGQNFARTERSVGGARSCIASIPAS